MVNYFIYFYSWIVTVNHKLLQSTWIVELDKYTRLIPLPMNKTKTVNSKKEPTREAINWKNLLSHYDQYKV